MKKIFLMMAFVAMTLGAAAQENSFNVKGGVGLSSLEDINDVTFKVNWKIGAGYEFRLNDLIGSSLLLCLTARVLKLTMKVLRIIRQSTLFMLRFL